MVTKEQLARYISLKKENENRLERLARMRSNAELPAQQQGGGSGGGSSGDRMAHAVEKCMEYEEQIRPIIQANRQEMAAIEQAVAALKDPLEREVLRLRYIDSDGIRPLTWKEIALIMYGDDDDCFVHACMRVQYRALSNLKK